MSPALAKKSDLKQQLCRLLEQEIEQMARIARDAANAATHEENKAEGDKDMRATEASYVARGQAGRVIELKRELGLVANMELRSFGTGATVEASALVVLTQGARRTTYFLVPAAGGRKLTLAGHPVSTLAITSPLGAALLGASVDDEIELETPQGPRASVVAGLE